MDVIAAINPSQAKKMMGLINKINAAGGAMPEAVAGAPLSEPSFDDIEDLLENLNYNAESASITKYCQNKKSLLLASSTQITTITGTSWQVSPERGHRSTDDDVCPILEKPGFYCVIDSELQNKLAPAFLSKFILAMKKGLVKRAEGENGIKFIINNKGIALIELKIDEDMRLYATEIIQNDKGQNLIIINKQGNHKKVKTVAQNSTLTKVIVNSMPDHKEQEEAPPTILDSEIGYGLQEGEEEDADGYFIKLAGLAEAAIAE